MFDVGFSELLVIGIVALVVIGPERLPRVARTAGILVGRLQRYVTQVKADINREMELSELSKVKTEFESAARGFQQDVQAQAADVEREVRAAQGAIEQELGAKASPAAIEQELSAKASPAAIGQDVSAQSAPAANDPAEAAALPPPSPQLELGIGEPTPRDKANG